MLLKNIYNKIISRPRYTYIAIFVFIFLIFGIFQLQPNFGDPDVFYHIKISKLMIEDQLVFTEFPWMQYSSLRDNFTDHHFLFHILLIPFIYIAGTIWGAKIAIAFFAASFFTCLYWFLQKFKFKHSELIIIALLLFNSFFFRLSLMKATPLSLIILLFLITYIFEKKYWQILLLSYIYVLTYGGWLLGLFIALIYIFSNILFFITQKKPILKELTNKLLSHHHLKIIISIIAGNILGIIINPYFPQNLKFYWQQIVDIGIVNYSNIIQVGNEWYSTSALSVIVSARFLLILLTIGILLTIFNHKKLNRQSIFFFLVSLIFFVLTLKSRRYIEYFAPFLAIFTGYLLTIYYTDLKKWIAEILKNRSEKPLYRSLFLIISILIIFTFFIQLTTTFRLLSNIPTTQFEQSSQFIKTKTPYHSTIFHSSWDEWPQLFYHNSTDYYIAGLDPTFAYKFNSKKYLLWRKLVTQPATNDFYSSIKNEFQANYVFANKRYLQFIKNLDEALYFKPIYEDEEVIIYQVL